MNPGETVDERIIDAPDERATRQTENISMKLRQNNNVL